MSHLLLVLGGWTGAFALASLAIWQAKELAASRREVGELTTRLVKLRVKALTGQDLGEYEDACGSIAGVTVTRQSKYEDLLEFGQKAAG